MPHPSSRRSVVQLGLYSAVTLLSGCTSSTDGGTPTQTNTPEQTDPPQQTDTTSSPTETPSDTPTSGSCSLPGVRRVTISDTATIPQTAGLEVTPTVEQAQITDNSTAQITVTMTNTGDTRFTNVFNEESCHLFNRSAGQSDPTGVWLYRQREAPTTPTSVCWRPDTDPEQSRTFIAIGCTRQRFDADDSITTTYEVWDDYTTEEYIQPGTYRFETSIPLWSSREAEEATQVDWWFELEITNPEG